MKLYFKFGDKVVISAVLEKQQIYDAGKNVTITQFVPVAIEKRLGIYIGFRTAQTGYTRYGEDGPEFKPTGKVTYLLVVINERQNPVKCDPQHVI